MPVRGGNGGPPPEDEGPEARMRWDAGRQGLGFADVDRIVIDPSALASIPVVILNDLNVLPVKLDVTTLYVAMGELSSQTMETLASFTDFRIVPVLALPDRILAARRRALERI